MMTLEEYFGGKEESRQIFDRLRELLESLGTVKMRVTKSQVAFYRNRGFAYAWMPGKYLRGRVAPLVLTVSLHRRDPSPRWKEVVEPVRGRFIHHMELYSPGDLDDQVRGWLEEAWTLAN